MCKKSTVKMMKKMQSSSSEVALPLKIDRSDADLFFLHLLAYISGMRMQRLVYVGVSALTVIMLHTY